MVNGKATNSNCLEQVVQKIVLVVIRIWLSFVAVAVAIGVVFLFFQPRDILRSDDPYAVGFACGTVAMGCAVVYSLLERLIAKKTYLVAAYLAALFALVRVPIRILLARR